MTDSPIRMNLRQLEVFKAVLECGSIRAAARRLHLTQPAVTHAMRELELGVGAELLRRSVKGVEPTELGAVLLRRSHLLLNELRRTQDDIAQLRDGRGGRLCIAFSSAAATHLLPAAMMAFRARYPGVALELQELTWPTMDERWHNGGYDFAVLGELDEPVQDGLQREVLFEMPLVVAARLGHPLRRARSILALREAAWVVPGYGLDVLERLFAARRQPPPQDVICCQSLSVAMAIMRQTDAVSMMSALSFQDPDAMRGLMALSLADKLPKARVSIVVRDPAALTQAAHRFIDCVRQAVPGFR